MDKPSALAFVNEAKYVTVDNYGTTELFASLRKIAAAYEISYTTISKCLSSGTSGVCKHGNGWLVVRRIQVQ